MSKLREAGLVDCEKRGIWAFYRLRKDLSHEKRALIEALA